MPKRLESTAPLGA